MIGNEVDYDLQPAGMCTLYELFKLLHSVLHVVSQVGVHIVIVGYGVRRTGIALHDGRMLPRNAVGAVVGLGGMTYDTCVPHMSEALLANLLQHARREVVELSTAVFLNRSKRFTRLTAIAIQTRKDLVDVYLTGCHEH